MTQTLFERMAAAQRDLLDQPDPVLRVLDFEATGLEVGAGIVEVAYTDLNVVTQEIGPTHSTLCRVDHMPPETRAIHHIRAEETRDFPVYDARCLYEQAVRDGVWGWAAYNSEFEERYILGRLPMFCVYKAALRLWPEAPAHGLFAVLYWLEDQGRIKFDAARAHPPHRAGPDTYATAVMLSAMFEEGINGKTLRAWTEEPRILPRCPIGKYRNQPWAECDWGFLDWIVRTITDNPDLRFNASLELERRRAQ